MHQRDRTNTEPETMGATKSRRPHSGRCRYERWEMRHLRTMRRLRWRGGGAPTRQSCCCRATTRAAPQRPTASTKQPVRSRRGFRWLGTSQYWPVAPEQCLISSNLSIYGGGCHSELLQSSSRSGRPIPDPRIEKAQMMQTSMPIRLSSCLQNQRILKQQPKTTINPCKKEMCAHNFKQHPRGDQATWGDR